MLAGIEAKIAGYLTKAVLSVDVTAGPDADSDTSRGVLVHPEFGQRPVELGKSFILSNLLSDEREPSEVTQGL